MSYVTDLRTEYYVIQVLKGPASYLRFRIETNRVRRAWQGKSPHWERTESRLGLRSSEYSLRDFPLALTTATTEHSIGGLFSCFLPSNL